MLGILFEKMYNVSIKLILMVDIEILKIK